MKKILLLLISLVLLVSLVSASNPQQHLYILERACAESNPTPIQQIACDNFETTVRCNLDSDYTVPKYFTEFVKYSNSHSPSLGLSLINLATNDEETACAIGAGTHMVADSVSHNLFVPPVIEKVFGTNEIIHALAEEAENDLLLEKDPQLRDRLNVILLGEDGFAYKKEIPFYIKGLQQNPLFTDENVEKNIDFLVTQITGKNRYDHGFGTAFVVPIEIWVTLGLVFLISVLGLLLALLKRNKTIWTWVLIIILIIPLILTILMFYGLFSGNLFTMYQAISKPITKILPLGDWESLTEMQIQNTIQFFNHGSSYLRGMQDPTGIDALQNAGRRGTFFRIILVILSLILLVLLSYFGVIRKIKKRT